MRMKEKFFKEAKRCPECGDLILDRKPHNHKKIITIIELLNMVANNTQPQKIKWGCHILEWRVVEYIANNEYGKPSLCDIVGSIECVLNDTIEILEESEELDDSPTISEEQALFNKLKHKDQEYIINFMRMLQPCEMGDNNEH